MSLQELPNWAVFVQYALLIFAAGYGLWQLTEATRARKLNAMAVAIAEIGSPKLRKLRMRVIHGQQQDVKEASDVKGKELDRIRRVAVAYDRVGLMVRLNLLPDRALYEFQSDEIQRLWVAMEPVIRHYRVFRDRPHYVQHFEWLAKKWYPKMSHRRQRRLAKMWRPFSRWDS